MKAAYGIDPMGQTAENVAGEHQISRTDQDAFAYRSQRRCKAAQDRGFFDKEIVKVCVKKGKTETIVDKDEHPRGDTTMETLSKLPAAFREGGSVTAGNSSGINDGACAMLYPHPDFIGTGAGGLLLEGAKRSGEAALELWCFQANTYARRFYERHGFKAIRLTDGHDNEEKMPDVRYRWQREPA